MKLLVYHPDFAPTGMCREWAREIAGEGVEVVDHPDPACPPAMAFLLDPDHVIETDLATGEMRWPFKPQGTVAPEG